MKYIDEFIFGNGESAVCCATRYDNIEILKYLIELGANVNIQFNYGCTPLFYASLETMKLLVEAGANVNDVNQYGDIPLSYACH